MLGFAANVVVNAVSIWVATLILPDVAVTGETLGESLISLLVVGLALAVVNAVLKPLVKLFTGCLYLVTFGLIAVVVNALMLDVASWLAGKVGVHFETGPFFWSTIIAALIVTLVSMALNLMLDTDSE